jgi:dipeptidyl aminopeptidase/acylaminoacyl peptidase
MSSPSEFEKYLSIEKAGGARWHPKEKRLVFTSDKTGVFQIYDVKVERGKTLEKRQLTFEEDRCTSPRYLRDGSIIFVRDRGGDENFQIGMIDKRGSVEWITSDLEVKHNVIFSTEEHLFFRANIEDKARMDSYRWKIPLDNNEPELIHRPLRGMVAPVSVSEQGNLVAMQEYIGNAEQHILVLDMDTGKVKNLTEPITGSVRTRWNASRWLDDNHFLVSTDLGSDLVRLAILSIRGDLSPMPEVDEILRFEVEEVGGIAHTRNSDWTYFAENDEGYSTIHRAKFGPCGASDVETLSFPLRGVLPNGDQRSWINQMSLSHDERYLAVTLSSGIQPTSIWVLDIKDMTSWRAVDVDYAGLSPTKFVEPTLHRFDSFDSLSVPYFRYLPQGEVPEKGWPAIFIIHGGPESQIRPSFDPTIQFFASAGFALITPNIRGSIGYGRAYLDADNVEKRLDSIMDIRKLVEHIDATDSEINAERLAVYGGSYGGFAVLSAMTEHPDLWKAGVDIVGISNFVTFLQNTAPWRRSLREAEYGSLEKDLDVLKKISPIHKIDRIAAPLMIIQGDNDERVPLSESIQMYEKLKEKGLPVELMRFSDEGHGLAKRENRIKALTRVLEWLKEIV